MTEGWRRWVEPPPLEEPQGRTAGPALQAGCPHGSRNLIPLFTTRGAKLKSLSKGSLSRSGLGWETPSRSRQSLVPGDEFVFDIDGRGNCLSIQALKDYRQNPESIFLWEIGHGAD